MEDNVSKIKERLNVVEVIADYIKIQKSGSNFKTRCPFHNEKTPSFHISPERQIWHCFGCSKGGDMFEFIREIEGVDFVDALRILAAKAGIEIKYISQENQTSEYADKEKLYQICTLSTKFFEKQLWQSAIGKKALAYLANRGMTEESIQSFHLGYAPDTPNALCDFLYSMGHSYDNILEAGVVGRSDKGVYYDRFRARIMFPIADVAGKFIGFSARIYENGLQKKSSDFMPAKYINTPQTAIYDKSKVLYGLDKARIAIKKENRCLVVEGNVDVILSHQVGVSNTVACSGTALTDNHLRIISRYTDTLDLCFDGDSAGEMATERGRDLSLFRSFTLNVLPVGNNNDIKDAADYIQKHGVHWATYVAQNRKPFLQFYIENLVARNDLAHEHSKKVIFQHILPLIKSLPSVIMQSHWLHELSIKTLTDEKALWEDLKTVAPKVEPEQFTSPYIHKESLDNLEPLEENIISIIIKEPALLGRVVLLRELFTPVGQDILRILEESTTGGNPGLKVAMAGLLSFEFAYLKSQELWKEFKPEELEDELQDSLSLLKKRKITTDLTKLEFLIKDAEQQNNQAALAQLVTQFNTIMFEINRLNNFHTIHDQTKIPK